MSQGWIKLHREIMEKAIWTESTPEQKTVLITLLMMANHERKEWEWKGKKYVAKPGQFVTSLESIAKNCGKGISIQNVRTALKRFEKYEFLTNESTKSNRLITIVNWRVYQDRDLIANKEPNKELTNDQQRPNKELTTNKNDKNDKNDDDIYISYINIINSITEKKQSSSSIQKFLSEFSESDFEKLVDEIKQSEYLKKNIDLKFSNKDFIKKVLQGSYRDFKKSKNTFNNFENTATKDFTEEDFEETARRKRKEYLKGLGL